MKYSVGIVLLVLFAASGPGWTGSAAAAARQADEARRHVESAGGFSFVPPDGWTVRKLPGLKYQVAVGPAAGGFAPNINVVDEAFAGSLDDYIKANIATMKKVLKMFRLVDQSDFQTEDKLKGARLAIEVEQQGKLLRLSQYIFDKDGTKLVVTCSALAEWGDRLDPVFEGSMKTFRIDKK